MREMGSDDPPAIGSRIGCRPAMRLKPFARCQRQLGDEIERHDEIDRRIVEPEFAARRRRLAGRIRDKAARRSGQVGHDMHDIRHPPRAPAHRRQMDDIDQNDAREPGTQPVERKVGKQARNRR